MQAEKIVQIAMTPETEENFTELVVLTDTGRIFQKSIDHQPYSTNRWFEIDLPDTLKLLKNSEKS